MSIAGPFTWGAGGRRMTPEQIEQQRQIAASLTQPDYSPIASPWQGLARVAGNITGALQGRAADRASDANAAESSSVLQALMAGGDKPDTQALTSAALNPYLDNTARKFAGSQLAALNKPAPTNDTVADYNFWKGALPPEQFEQYIANKVNPPHFAVLPNGQMGMVGGYQPESVPVAPPSAPVGKLTPIGDGGQTPASGGFR
jgi:hypothetical protein